MFEHPGLALLRERKARAVEMSDELRENLVADLQFVVQASHYVDRGWGIATFLYRQRYIFIGALGVIIASRLKGFGGRIKGSFTLANLWKIWGWARKAMQFWQIYRQASFVISMARRRQSEG